MVSTQKMLRTKFRKQRTFEEGEDTNGPKQPDHGPV